MIVMSFAVNDFAQPVIMTILAASRVHRCENNKPDMILFK